MSAKNNNRKFDLIIYGATGFTGQLAVEYVHRHYPDLKLALAGRNKAKLESVRDRLFTSGKQPSLIVADAQQDPAVLQEMAASTKVVANYAGTPFIDKALPVVKACAEVGTCYADITAEVPLQRTSYDLYHKDAVKSGALILHACGYDSVPSDLGAMMAADAMKERYGCDCKSLEFVAGKSKGGASGGTIQTAMQLIFDGKDMPGMKESKQKGCYALDPEGGTGGPDTKDTAMLVEYSDVSNKYVIPFFMAGANAPVVRKTNALLGYKYGKNCTYREVQSVPGRLAGYAYLLGIGVFGMLMAMPPTRWLLLTYVLPKPGEGPSRELQENGFFNSRVYATGDSLKKPKVVAYVKSGDAGDPGYKATARMSIESSLCMALEREQCAEGGVLTPAAGIGKVLVGRLNKTGMKLGVEDAAAS